MTWLRARWSSRQGEGPRGYFIPDFLNRKSHDDFERAFARLYEDLKASAV